MTLQHLKAMGRGDLPVSMNASYREFSQKDFVARIADKLDRLHLAHENFELELPEEHLMRNAKLSEQLTSQISAYGLQLSLDEFCAGTSNIAYLQMLPVSHVKLSRKSVSAISGDASSGIMAKTAIALAHNLNIRTIAEGVESQTQLDFLRTQGCDEYQGYLFKAPIAREELEKLLEAA